MNKQWSVLTLNFAYNKKNMWRFSFVIGSFLVKDNIFKGEWEIFGAEVYLYYRQFFIKGDFIIDGVECMFISAIKIFM